jgi:cell division transport system permease protein
MQLIERLFYFLRRGLANLVASPLLAVITVMTVAMSLVLVGFMVFVLLRADSVLEEAGGGFKMTVYMDPTLTVQECEELARVVREQFPEVDSARVFSARDDLERNRALLPPEILEGLEEDLIPAQPYLEVTTDIRRLKPERLENMVVWFRSLKQVEGVDEILLGSEKLRVAFSLLDSFRYTAVFVALVVTLSALFFIFATIRLSAHARREEMDIMLLMGASRDFVRLPFYIEGALEGVLGGVIGWLMVAAMEHRMITRLRTENLLNIDGTIMPGQIWVLFLLGGLLLGVLGAAMGVGKYLRLQS